MTLGSGGTLTVNGSVTKNGVADTIHTINIGARTMSVGGDLILSQGSGMGAIILAISTGTVTVTGSLTQAGSASIVFTGAGNLNIGGNFNYTSGTFTASTCTVTYNGAGEQVVASGITYNNLSFNKASGTAMITSATSITGNLSLSTGGELNLGAAVTVGGNVTIGSGTVLSENGITLTVGGSWMGSGTFNSSSGTVLFNSSGNPTIALTTFNNLIINKPGGTLTAGTNMTINGNLTIASGTLDLASYTADRSFVGGTFTMSAGATLKIGGAANFPANYNTKTFSPTSTVEYNGTGGQTIKALTYGNLVLTNGGTNTKNLAGAITVSGNLTINSGASLDADSSTLSLLGDFNNSGTFIPDSSTVVLMGGDSTNIKSLNGATSFYNFIVEGYYATTPGTDLTFWGDYEVTIAGYFNTGNNTTIEYGNTTTSGTTIGDGTSIIMGTREQVMRMTGTSYSPAMTNTISLRGTVAPIIDLLGDFVAINLEMSNTSATGIVGNVDVMVLGYFLVSNGCKWIDGGKHFTFLGDYVNYGTVVSTGTLTFAAGPPLNYAPSTTIYLGSGNHFQSTGTVEFAGANHLIINGTPDSMNNITINNTNAAGITPAAGWIVNGDFTVGSGATFHAGYALSHTFHNDIRIAGTFDGGTSTVTTTSSDSSFISGEGHITFYNLIIAGHVDAITDFSIAGNFINNGTFEPAGMTVYFTGDSASIIDGSTTPVPFENLRINKTSNALTLNVPVSVSMVGTFTKGVVNTTAVNYLNFLAGSSVLGGNTTSYVDGPVRKTGNSAFVFPVGDRGSYRTIAMSAPSVVTDHFTAQYFKQQQTYGSLNILDTSLVTLSNCEYWVLNRTNGTSAVNVTLSWYSPDCSPSYIYDPTKLAVARWNGNAWVSHGNGGTTGTSGMGTVITSSPVTSFRPFTLGSSASSNSLPIELVSFDAAMVDEKVVAKWNTAIEINNDYFNVERSSDGVNFQIIGKVSGAGNSTTAVDYEFVDNNPLTGVSYYRLSQTDYDGHSSSFNVVPINMGSLLGSKNNFTVYPNPANDQLFLSLNTSDDVKVSIFDMTGRELFAQVYSDNNNSSPRTISISIASILTPVVYLLTAYSGSNEFKEKLVVR